METNKPNPYETPESKPDSRSPTAMDILAVGVWMVNLAMAFIGRSVLLDFFEEFGIELPSAAILLLNFYTQFVFAAVVLVSLLVVIFVSQGAARRMIVFSAALLGGAVFAAALMSVLNPLFTFLRALA